MIISLFRLYCDDGNCTISYAAQLQDHDNARKIMSERGWTTFHSRGDLCDRCPDCTNKISSLERIAEASD